MKTITLSDDHVALLRATLAAAVVALRVARFQKGERIEPTADDIVYADEIQALRVVIIEQLGE